MALRILMQPSDLEAVCNCKDDQPGLPGGWAMNILLTFRLLLGLWGFGIQDDCELICIPSCGMLFYVMVICFIYLVSCFKGVSEISLAQLPGLLTANS